MKLYEITRRGGPLLREITEVVGTNLTWQQALLIMADGDMNIDYALASLDYKQSYSFHDKKGHLCWLREFTVVEGPIESSGASGPRNHLRLHPRYEGADSGPTLG